MVYTLNICYVRNKLDYKYELNYSWIPVHYIQKLKLYFYILLHKNDVSIVSHVSLQYYGKCESVEVSSYINLNSIENVFCQIEGKIKFFCINLDSETKVLSLTNLNQSCCYLLVSVATARLSSIEVASRFKRVKKWLFFVT